MDNVNKSGESRTSREHVVSVSASDPHTDASRSDESSSSSTQHPSVPNESSNRPAIGSPTTDTAARDRLEATSAERTSSLKAARDAALQSANHPIASGSHVPVNGTATPSRPTNIPPPRPLFDSSLLVQTSPREELFTGLRRLGYILSLVLGSSAVIGLFWSTFFLPLLQSTFSARQVILEQQLPRFKSLLDGLKALRGNAIYPALVSGNTARVDEEKTGDNGQLIKLEHQSGIEEIRSETSTSSSIRRSRKFGKDESATAVDLNPLPIDSLSSLSAKLSELASAISSTSTTRTSLLSTLEAYTAQLHREVYLRSDHRSNFSVGLGSLSQNLAASGGGSTHLNGGSITDVSDWDEVRKEVRAIKGLLLGRRSLMAQ